MAIMTGIDSSQVSGNLGNLWPRERFLYGSRCKLKASSSRGHTPLHVVALFLESDVGVVRVACCGVIFGIRCGR